MVVEHCAAASLIGISEVGAMTHVPPSLEIAVLGSLMYTQMVVVCGDSRTCSSLRKFRWVLEFGVAGAEGLRVFGDGR